MRSPSLSSLQIDMGSPPAGRGRAGSSASSGSTRLDDVAVDGARGDIEAGDARPPPPPPAKPLLSGAPGVCCGVLLVTAAAACGAVYASVDADSDRGGSESVLAVLMLIGLVVSVSIAVVWAAVALYRWRADTASKEAREKRYRVNPASPCMLCSRPLGRECPVHAPSHRIGDAAFKAHRRMQEQKQRSGYTAPVLTQVNDACPSSRGRCGHWAHFHCMCVHLLGQRDSAPTQPPWCPDAACSPFLWEFGTAQERTAYAEWLVLRQFERDAKRSGAAWFGSNPFLAAEPDAVSPSASRGAGGADASATSRGRSPSSPERLSRTDSFGSASALSVGSMHSGTVPRHLEMSHARRNRVVLEPLTTPPSGASGARLKQSKSSGSLSRSSVSPLPANVAPDGAGVGQSSGTRGRSRSGSTLRRAKSRVDVIRSDARAGRAALARHVSSPDVTAKRARDKLAGAADDSKCPVCKSAPREVVFPCGHCMCGRCGRQLSECPFCSAHARLPKSFFGSNLRTIYDG